MSNTGKIKCEGCKQPYHEDELWECGICKEEMQFCFMCCAQTHMSEEHPDWTLKEVNLDL